MEHDGKDFEDILGGVDENEPDFEQFLKEKTACLSPISEMKELAVPDAVVSSKNGSSSTETGETSDPSSSEYVDNVGEKQTRIDLHKHDVVGAYITETVEPARIDEEWKKVFVETYKTAVVECTPEQVIERFHQLERTVFLIRAQQASLHGPVLEELLKAETSARRAEILALDQKHRARQQKKGEDSVKGERKAKVAKAGAKSSKGKTAGMKGADTLKSLGFTQEAVTTSVSKQGLLDEATAAYIAKLFA